jgi:hypothetical protein
MIKPHLHARRDAGREGAKLPVHPWRMGSNASGASGSPRRMDADPFKRAIIDADKDRDGSVLQCHRAGRIRTPHLIRTRRDDCAVMDAGSHDARCPNDYIREGLINSCLHEKLCSWVNAYGQSGGNLLVRESLSRVSPAVGPPASPFVPLSARLLPTSAVAPRTDLPTRS